MAIVRRGDGTLLFFNAVPVDEEALARIRALGTPSVLVVPQHLHVIDAHALRAQLGEMAATPGLARIVPSHGAVIDRDPGGVLREIAASL
jgi:hypothetical protein